MVSIHTTLSKIIDRDRKSTWLLPLYLISLIYGGIISLRNILYDHNILTQKKVSVKVISIGNITIGGTGKTPAVIMLAQILKKNGYRPAVVSRGYGGKSLNPVNIASNGDQILIKTQEAGDEPVLIARRLTSIPVITGKDRYAAARYALKNFDINLIILDDAFQHRTLFRDVDILLLDAKRPFGNGLLIPGGRLREPTGSIERADIIVATGNREENASTISRIIEERFSSKILFTGYRKTKDIMNGHSGEILSGDCLRGRKIYAFSGIAQPDNFLQTITDQGGIVTGELIFPDHHVYKKEDLKRIKEQAAASRADMILTTEKDYMKLVDFGHLLKDIFILRITMEVAQERELEKYILARLAEK